MLSCARLLSLLGADLFLLFHLRPRFLLFENSIALLSLLFEEIVENRRAPHLPLFTELFLG